MRGRETLRYTRKNHERFGSSKYMDILEKLPNGVDTVIGAKGVYLSGCEKQRITISCVF